MTRDIVVTGAGGFVCSSIVDVLLEAGWFVYAVDLAFDAPLQTGWLTDYHDQIRFYDRLPDVQVSAMLHGAALTASPEEAGQTPVVNFRANIVPYLRTVDWARIHVTGRSIYLSSSAVYRTSAPGKIDETMPQQPLGTYAVAKTTIEHLTDTLKIMHGDDVAAVRLSNIYGERETTRPSRPRMSLVGQYVDAALAGESITVDDPDALRDWTYARDIGYAVLALLERKTLDHALYNVASGETLKNIELAQKIRNLIPSTDIVTGENAASHPRQGTLNPARLEQATGFNQWTPFDEGLSRMITYRQAQVQTS